MKDNITRFKAVTKDMAALYEKKNTDYGNAFEDNLDAEGSVNSGITRLNEKISRLKQTVQGEAKVTDESIEDTLMDVANYAVMSLMWLRKQPKKKRFIPEEGQFFYYINAIGTICSIPCLRKRFDMRLIGIGNCFETEEEAEPYAKKFKELFK